MELSVLVEACATGIACGGFQALGVSLSALTIKMIRKLRNFLNDDEDAIQEKVLSEFSKPNEFANDAEALAKNNPDFRMLLDEWRSSALQYAQSSQQIKAESISHSNMIGSVIAKDGSNITISQSCHS